MKCAVILTQKASKNLQADIQNWLAANPNVNIKFVSQSSTNVGLFTTIFYED